MSRRRERPGEKPLTKNALDSTFFSEALRSGKLFVDGDGDLQTISVFQNYLNGMNGTVEPARTMNMIRYAHFTAVATPVAAWTPAAGKRFRLMGFIINFTGDFVNTGAGALSYINIYDGATTATLFAFYIGANAAGSAMLSPIVINLPGNGYLSIARDNILYFNLQATALTSGFATIHCWGTEE